MYNERYSDLKEDGEFVSVLSYREEYALAIGSFDIVGSDVSPVAKIGQIQGVPFWRQDWYGRKKAASALLSSFAWERVLVGSMTQRAYAFGCGAVQIIPAEYLDVFHAPGIDDRPKDRLVSRYDGTALALGFTQDDTGMFVRRLDDVCLENC